MDRKMLVKGLQVNHIRHGDDDRSPRPERSVTLSTVFFYEYTCCITILIPACGVAVTTGLPSSELRKCADTLRE
jgi:hypothetical protein